MPQGYCRRKSSGSLRSFWKPVSDDIEVTEGRAVVLGTDRAVTFKQIAKAVYSDMKTLPVEAREELSATYTYDPINGTTAAATHIAVVEVDPVTCFVRILKFIVAEDCGRLINPMIVDGQVHGGVAQGIGAALFEELIYDEDGQLLDREPRRLRGPFRAREVPI